MSTAWDSSHAPAVPWRSGPWSLELRDDELADVRFDGRRVLRSIRAVVRDRDWNTAAFSTESVTSASGFLEVAVSTTAYGAEVRGTVRAAPLGSELHVTFEASSGAEFVTNRTGLVVLHPPQVAGADLRGDALRRRDRDRPGSRARSARTSRCSTSPLEWTDDGVRGARSRSPATCSRWKTSATGRMPRSRRTAARSPCRSRTSCPPAAGSAERRAVALRIRDDRGRARRRAERTLEPRPDRPAARRIEFPSIGLGRVDGAGSRARRGAARRVVLVELDLADPELARRARAGRGERDAARCALPRSIRESALDAGRQPSPHSAAWSVVASQRVPPGGRRRHVSDRDAVIAVARAMARDGRSTCPVIGGSRSHFTELNRERHRIPRDLDGLAVTVTPLFHAGGTEQLVESVAMQRLVAAQTVALAAGRPVHIGPITLRPRFNDVATARQRRADARRSRRRLRRRVHRYRQTHGSPSPELAAWTDRERRGPRRPRGGRASRTSRSGGHAASAPPPASRSR